VYSMQCCPCGVSQKGLHSVFDADTNEVIDVHYCHLMVGSRGCLASGQTCGCGIVLQGMGLKRGLLVNHMLGHVPCRFCSHAKIYGQLCPSHFQGSRDYKLGRCAGWQWHHVTEVPSFVRGQRSCTRNRWPSRDLKNRYALPVALLP